MGKTAFHTPSAKDQPTTPQMLEEAKRSGTMPIAGATNRASTTVTARVMSALLYPGILQKSIRIKSNSMGMRAISDDIGLKFTQQGSKF